MDITRKGDHVTIDINDDRKLVVEIYRINFGGDHAYVVRKIDGRFKLFSVMADAIIEAGDDISSVSDRESVDRFLRYFAS